MNAAEHTRDEVPPWLAKLTPRARAKIAEGVANWPPLTDRQRERLELLFRPRTGGTGGDHAAG